VCLLPPPPLPTVAPTRIPTVHSLPLPRGLGLGQGASPNTRPAVWVVCTRGLGRVFSSGIFARLSALYRPRARVLLVVWAWDLVVIRLLCCGLPAPARRQFFALRFVIPDFETRSARGDSVHHPFFPPNVKTFRAIKMS